MNSHVSIAEDVILGKDVYISKFVNLYGCTIGDQTKVGAFVEIQKEAIIGKKCKIGSHTFICSGVTIEDECFIGHGVKFINDNYPRAVNKEGLLEAELDWEDRYVKTHIGRGAILGTGVIVLGNISIGEGAIIGAGSVVTKNVPPHEVWIGNPARFYKKITIKVKK